MSSEKLYFPAALRKQLEPYVPKHELSDGQSKIDTKQMPKADHSSKMHVTLTYAQSLDSRIAVAPGRPTAISGQMSKAMTHYLRTKHDAILIGCGTAIADDPTLNSRLEGATLASLPQPVILDRHLKWQVHDNSKVVSAAREGKGKPPWILTTGESNGTIEATRTLQSCSLVEIILYEGRLLDALEVLRQRGLRSVMIEGGATIINELLSNHPSLIDSVIVTIAPVFFGQQGVQVSPHAGVTDGKSGEQLQDVSWMPLYNDMILCARPAMMSTTSETSTGEISGDPSAS